MITKLRRYKKDSWQAVFFSIFLVFLALGVIGFLVFSNWKINQRRAEFQQKIETLKREIQILKEKNAAWRAGIIRAEGEAYQRERLYEEGYVEKGATQVVVLPPKEEAEEKIPKPKSIWQRFLEKLGF